MGDGFFPLQFFLLRKQVDFVPNMQRVPAGDAQLRENFVYRFIQFLVTRA